MTGGRNASTPTHSDSLIFCILSSILCPWTVIPDCVILYPQSPKQSCSSSNGLGYGIVFYGWLCVYTGVHHVLYYVHLAVLFAAHSWKVLPRLCEYDEIKLRSLHLLEGREQKLSPLFMQPTLVFCSLISPIYVGRILFFFWWQNHTQLYSQIPLSSYCKFKCSRNPGI